MADGPGGTPRYSRVLLKLSGEALAGKSGQAFDPEVFTLVAQEVEDVTQAGVQVAIVVGGGNIIRGAQLAERTGIDRVTADHMGLLATVINALALSDFLEREGLVTRLLTAIEMRQVAEPFIRRRAIRHLEKGRVVIFAAGTGSPHFTTDTAAALRAIEVEADAVLITKHGVGGIYDKDPNKSTDAVMFRSLDYIDMLNLELKVMDATAVALCKDNNMPIHVFELRRGNLKRLLLGEEIGTLVGGSAGDPRGAQRRQRAHAQSHRSHKA